MVMASSNGGPYVHAAVLCQTFIKGEQSHALSLINILDTVTIGGADPDEMPPVALGPGGISATLVVNLWAGHAKSV
jgi:hypothetical protein